MRNEAKEGAVENLGLLVPVPSAYLIATDDKECVIEGKLFNSALWHQACKTIVRH